MDVPVTVGDDSTGRADRQVPVGQGIAAVDELEKPAHVRQRFTVGY